MTNIIGGIFVVLHGLVHGLYFGQSQRLFELQPEMAWPDGSWTFSQMFGDATARRLASTGCIVAGAGFVVGGIGVLADLDWWRPVVVVMSTLSSALFILCWNGKMQKLHDQGGVAILINAALVIAALGL
jgi:hypothetical protein